MESQQKPPKQPPCRDDIIRGGIFGGDRCHHRSFDSFAIEKHLNDISAAILFYAAFPFGATVGAVIGVNIVHLNG